jgi:putative peptide zinc metalloprotease protein
VSTVLFNANPLLRFDGYYIFSDLIEIPNLRQRANQYFLALFQRWLFGLEVAPVGTTRGERAWLFCFAVASFIYRVTITLAIAVFVASAYIFIGILLAIWTVISAFVLPLVTLIAFLSWSPRLARHRARAVTAAVVLGFVLFALVFLLPVPMWTNAQGVIWAPEQAAVRTGADGFVRRVLVEPGQRVARGEPLIEAEDPALTMRVRSLEGQKAELEARYQAELVNRLARAQQTLDQLKAVNADLERARERAGDLVARSTSDGIFTVPSPQDLPGRFVKKGDALGYVVPESTLIARVLVPQQSVALVRQRTRRVLVKLVEHIEDTIPARIVREVPGASDRLPSLALSQAGGGELVLDPMSSREPKTLQKQFEFEIELPYARAAGLGERIYVRFEHGTETIADQVWRSVRQLFLRQFTA